jgi:hypothetical protein
LTGPFCLSCTATYLAVSILHKILYPYKCIFIFSFNTICLPLNNNRFFKMASYAFFRSTKRQCKISLLLKYFLTHVLIIKILSVLFLQQIPSETVLAVYGTMCILLAFIYIFYPLFVAAKFHNLLMLCALALSQKCLLALSYLRPFVRLSSGIYSAPSERIFLRFDTCDFP